METITEAFLLVERELELTKLKLENQELQNRIFKLNIESLNLKVEKQQMFIDVLMQYLNMQLGK